MKQEYVNLVENVNNLKESLTPVQGTFHNYTRQLPGGPLHTGPLVIALGRNGGYAYEILDANKAPTGLAAIVEFEEKVAILRFDGEFNGASLKNAQEIWMDKVDYIKNDNEHVEAVRQLCDVLLELINNPKGE